MVGVLPPFMLGGCNGPNCGSVVATTPGHAPNDPEPLLMIRLPAPALATDPATMHSFSPLLDRMVSSRVKFAELSFPST